MAPPVAYAAGVFSLNALGDDFLSYTVTQTTFRGPAAVLVVDAFDFDYEIVVDFIAQFNAPLVGVAQNSIDSAGRAYLRGAYDMLGRFYDSARSRKPRLPTSLTTDIPVVYGGPFFAAGLSNSDVNIAAVRAWELAITYTRTTQNHPYGLGMQAVSVFSTSNDNLSPPVYQLTPGDVGIASDLKTLTKKWLAEAVPTVTQYESLYAAAVARPGLGAKINPVLIPQVLLAEPIEM